MQSAQVEVTQQNIYQVLGITDPVEFLRAHGDFILASLLKNQRDFPAVKAYYSDTPDRQAFLTLLSKQIESFIISLQYPVDSIKEEMINLIIWAWYLSQKEMNVYFLAKASPLLNRILAAKEKETSASIEEEKVLAPVQEEKVRVTVPETTPSVKATGLLALIEQRDKEKKQAALEFKIKGVSDPVQLVKRLGNPVLLCSINRFVVEIHDWKKDGSFAKLPEDSCHFLETMLKDKEATTEMLHLLRSDDITPLEAKKLFTFWTNTDNLSIYNGIQDKRLFTPIQNPLQDIPYRDDIPFSSEEEKQLCMSPDSKEILFYPGLGLDGAPHEIEQVQKYGEKFVAAVNLPDGRLFMLIPDSHRADFIRRKMIDTPSLLHKQDLPTQLMISAIRNNNIPLINRLLHLDPFYRFLADSAIMGILNDDKCTNRDVMTCFHDRFQQYKDEQIKLLLSEMKGGDAKQVDKRLSRLKESGFKLMDNEELKKAAFEAIFKDSGFMQSMFTAITKHIPEWKPLFEQRKEEMAAVAESLLSDATSVPTEKRRRTGL